MKKSLRSLLVLLVVLLMAITTACSTQDTATNTTEPEETKAEAAETVEDEMDEEDSAETGGRLIGINYYGTGSYVLGVLKNNSEVVVKACGDEPLSLDNSFNIDKIVTDVQSMIQSGVDGIILWTPVQSQMLKIA